MTEIHLLDKLPLEILVAILKQLRLKDVSALARCDTHSYNTLNVSLYSLDAKQPDRWALHWAAMHGVLATASKSLAARSPPNQYCDTRAATLDHRENRKGPPLENDGPASTVLEIAICYDHEDIVAILLSYGSECSTHPASRQYGLDQAIENNRSDWVKLYDVA